MCGLEKPWYRTLEIWLLNILRIWDLLIKLFQNYLWPILCYVKKIKIQSLSFEVLQIITNLSVLKVKSSCLILINLLISKESWAAKVERDCFFKCKFGVLITRMLFGVLITRMLEYLLIASCPMISFPFDPVLSYSERQGIMYDSQYHRLYIVFLYKGGLTVHCSL